MTRLWWFVVGAFFVLAACLALIFSPLGGLILDGPAVGAGYAAEVTCGGVFVTGRDPDTVWRDDILPVDPLLRHADFAVDRQGQTVAVTLGFATRTALYRPGLGCTLVGASGLEALLRQADGITPMSVRARPDPWPAGDKADPVETPALKAALDDAFGGAAGVATRAIVIVKNGRILAERYSTGFDRDSRLLGWSMSKSVTAALEGNLLSGGSQTLDDKAPVAGWAQAVDGRQNITLKQLLNMTAGLRFDETYRPGDDATTMLYRQDDMAGFAARLPMSHPAGTVWSYSSGSANIVSRIVFEAAGGTLSGAYNFARTHLFEPAGMTSAIFEPDASGNPVGSSYLYMTARDWARFGLLYLDDGLLGWQRILSPEWVAATRQPARTTDGKTVPYGLFFWLNGDGVPGSKPAMPHCPADLYWADGHNGQIVAIVPSEGLVVVRLGWDTGETGFDTDRHLAAIIAAVKAN